MLPVRRTKLDRCGRRSARVRALVFVLCLVTWRGPLPWLHDHEVDQRIAAKDASLSEHLAAYHALSRGHAEHGWHVHMLLPFGRCPCPHHEEHSAPVQDPLSTYGTLMTKSVAVPALDAASPAWCLPSLLDAPADRHAVAVLHPASSDALSFLSGLLAGAPLRAVTGVALC